VALYGHGQISARRYAQHVVPASAVGRDCHGSGRTCQRVRADAVAHAGGWARDWVLRDRAGLGHKHAGAVPRRRRSGGVTRHDGARNGSELCASERSEHEPAVYIFISTF
jgi:hypothetical protein